MATTVLVRVLLIAASSATLCFSFSFLFYRQESYDFSMVDLGHLSFPSFPSSGTNHPKGDISLGRRIVEKAFNESFSELVEVCGKLDKQDSLQKCLDKLYRRGKAPSTPASSLSPSNATNKWPWWFHTMIRDAKQPSTGLFGPWHFLQFTDPLMQLCVYEKGGTKMWRHLHCQVLSRTMNTSGITLTNCFSLQGPSATYNVKRSVFLRDPLERFLSAFLDKCTAGNRIGQAHCQPNIIFRSNQTDHVADYLVQTQKLFEIHVDVSPLKWDLHFLPLSLHCGGLYNRIKQYDFVGMMNQGFYQELGRFIEQYPSLEPNVRKTFKMEGKENSVNYGTERQAALHTWEYYTPNTIRKVLQYTSIDYMLLNLSIPQWAEEILKKDNTFVV